LKAGDVLFGFAGGGGAINEALKAGFINCH
jgi:hypothetical protein